MKKKSKGDKYLAGHQRSWVWGRHAVVEILDAAMWPMLDLYLSDDLPEEKVKVYGEQARQLGAEVMVVARDRLRELCGVPEHQGFLARMGPYPYATWTEVLEAKCNVASPPLYLVLDAMRDAHNFGAIVRSAAALMAAAVIVGVKNQAPVNNHVARASAGAINRMPIVQVDSLVEIMHTLRQQGVVCAATDPRGTVPAWSYDFNRPVALVMGNENAGISEELLELCDDRIVIPGSGVLDSLNVAAASAALLYEAQRQKQHLAL